MFLINFRSTIHSPIFKINESALPASFKRNVREQVFKKTISVCQNDTEMTTPKYALRRTLAAPNSLNDAGLGCLLIFKKSCE